MSYDYNNQKERWQAINMPSVKYHLEQLEMQIGSCHRQIELGNLDDSMLVGYIGELQWQLKGLNELIDNVPDEPELCCVCDGTVVPPNHETFCPGACCAECGEALA